MSQYPQGTERTVAHTGPPLPVPVCCHHLLLVVPNSDSEHKAHGGPIMLPVSTGCHQPSSGSLLPTKEVASTANTGGPGSWAQGSRRHWVVEWATREWVTCQPSAPPLGILVFLPLPLSLLILHPRLSVQCLGGSPGSEAASSPASWGPPAHRSTMTQSPSSLLAGAGLAEQVGARKGGREERSCHGHLLALAAQPKVSRSC